MNNRSSDVQVLHVGTRVRLMRVLMASLLGLPIQKFFIYLRTLAFVGRHVVAVYWLDCFFGSIGLLLMFLPNGVIMGRLLWGSTRA